MKLSVQAVNFDVAKQLDEYINKKTARFARHLREDDELVIRLSVVKPATNLNKQVDVRIGDLFASKTCDTFIRDTHVQMNSQRIFSIRISYGQIKFCVSLGVYIDCVPGYFNRQIILTGYYFIKG